MTKDDAVPVTAEDADYTDAERALLNSLGGYRKVFNAIADGTSIWAKGSGISITVKGFIRSIARHRGSTAGVDGT